MYISDQFVDDAISYYKKIKRSARGYFLTANLNDVEMQDILHANSKHRDCVIVTNKTDRSLWTINQFDNVYAINTGTKVCSIYDFMGLDSVDLKGKFILIDFRDGELDYLPLKDLRPFFWVLRTLIKDSPIMIVADNYLPAYSLLIIDISWAKLVKTLGLNTHLSFKQKIRWVLF